MSNPSFNAEPVVDLDQAVARLDNDPTLLRELAEMFLEDGRETLSRLTASIDSMHWEEAVRAAHSLKGLLRTFDAEQAASVAAACESDCRAQRAEAGSLLPSLEAELARVEAVLRDYIAGC